MPKRTVYNRTGEHPERARKLRMHPQEVKDRIQATQILNRFQMFFFGQTDGKNGPVNLTPAQIRVGEILLKKSVPDLSSVQVSGDEDQPLINNLVVTFVKPAPQIDDLPEADDGEV